MDAIPPKSRSLRRMYSHRDAREGISTGDNLGHSAGYSTTAMAHPALIAKYRKPGQNLADAASATEFSSKRWVWCPDAQAGYVGGWVVDEDAQNGTCTVACVDDKTRTVSADEISKMNPPKFDRVEDIADLTFLNEASVVHNLRERYTSDMIYTYSGPFLVAVNPYRSLPIYGQDAIQLYKSRRKEECPPHVFAIAERAWQNMVGEREGQSILITGESGAGKTENTKKVIQYLTAIAAEAAHALPPSGSASSIEDTMGRSHTSAGAARAEGRELENQIIQANPILEAFGNAQTVRNNNSSRFGKFVRIEFASAGTIAGATIDWYLLEKSRVTARSEKERNFHVFYQLLRGASRELKRELLLAGGPEDYEYLKHSRLSIEGVDDNEEWRSLEHALRVVGFSAAEQFNLFRVVSAILHIGNIAVTGSGTEQAYIRDNSALEKVCHLLGLPLVEFSKALLRPKVKAGREWVTQSRSKKQVEDEMGALCKAMYEKSFGALVDRINRALDRPTIKSTFIGVLDIAGFEIFETNGFEQLCINYTNEKLQQFFNHHMFILEQEEYARESIDWEFVNFGHDLQPTIDLIESTSPIGILSCLDEECIMPKASDATFTDKLHQLNKRTHRNSVLEDKDGSIAQSTSKYAPARFDMGFTITHYAGKVEYRTDGWLDKNRDPLNANITSVLANSSVEYIASLFEEYRDEDIGDVDQRNGNPKRRTKKGAFRTVAQRHKEHLKSLMSQLQDTQPHFVRCIVPNNKKKAGQVDVPLVLDQLRCNGVLEGIRIARLGYPNRLPFVEFKQRYEVLTPGIIPKGYMDGRKASQRITEALELDSAVFRIGLNKIFFKSGILAELEEKRDELLYDIFARLQAGCRKFVCMRRVRKQLNRDAAIRTIQRNARIYLELKSWPWWPLYTKVRPLLAATRTDEALKRKEAELLLVQERAIRDQQEKEKLGQLKQALEAERKKIQDTLDNERAANADKDDLLARLKQRQTSLEEEVATMQIDLDTLDSQLDRALVAHAASEKRFTDVKQAFDDAAIQLARLEAETQNYRSRDANLADELDNNRAQIEALTQSKLLLTSQLDTAQRKLAEKSEDHQRAQQRLEASQADLQGKLGILLREKELRSAQLVSAETQQRSLEQQIAELKRAADSAESSAKQKDRDAARLQGQITSAQDKERQASNELSETRVRVDTLTKQLFNAKSESERIGQQKAAVESELDKMKMILAAKSSEDVKQREVASLKEQEIVELRSQVRALNYELEATSRSSSEKVDSLRIELENAKEASSTASSALVRAVNDVKEHSLRLAEVERVLAASEQSSRSTASQLDMTRTQLQEAERQLKIYKTERDSFERQVTDSRASLQSLEDVALQAQRDVSAKQLEMEALGDRLEAEMTKRMHLEKAARTTQNEIDSLQLRIVEQDQYISGLRKDLQERNAELAKSLSMQDKTIVEHVHVLEEAKRYTDKQLADTQSRLASLTTYSRTLEKTKARLQAELEDLTLQNDRERLDERAIDRQFRKLEEQAEKAVKRLEQEERIRQVAEQDVARLTAEVQRLKQQAASVNGPAVGMARSRSAFENTPPPGHEPQGINGSSTKRRYDGLMADLEHRDIYNKDGVKDDALRGRILRELTDANRELAAGMRGTLAGVSSTQKMMNHR